MTEELKLRLTNIFSDPPYGLEGQAQPSNVTVVSADGTTKRMRFEDIIEHDREIIEDNIFYGYQSGYSKQEIARYEREAFAALAELKRRFREDPTIHLRMDRATERYVVEEGSKK